MRGECAAYQILLTSVQLELAAGNENPDLRSWLY